MEPYRDRAHIIIVGDHSWPVGIQGNKDAERGATPENFMIPFLYVPPRDSGAAYRRDVVIEKPLLGQSDITPTVLELLSGRPQLNSFAALLRQPADGKEPKLPPEYDDCQVSTQPYDGGQIVVARGNRRVRYRFDLHQVRESLLLDDLSEVLGDDKQRMAYREFLGQHLCSRFRYWVSVDKNTPQPKTLRIPHYSF